MPDVIPDRKVCSSCRQDLPCTDFHRAKSTADGLQYYCRACYRGYRRARRLALLAGAKCTACGKIKPWSDWIQLRGSATGYMDRCGACVTSRMPERRRRTRVVDHSHYSRYLDARG